MPPSPGAKPDATGEFDYAQLIQQPSAWRELTDEQLQRLAFFAIAGYGRTADDGFVRVVSQIYGVVLERFAAQERKDLLQMVNESVERGVTTVSAFFPFIFQDPETGVISSAALNYAVLGPPDEGDVLAAAKHLFGIAEQQRSPRVRVGIIIGLLLLGDRRVQPILRRCWLKLSRDERQRLAHAYSGFVYASVVDFYLEWLEDADEESFGLVAAALTNMPHTAAVPEVLDVERVLPATAAGDGSSVHLLGRWTFEQYGRLIEPRLRDLLRRESEPKVLPHVMVAWGLAP